MSSGVQLHRLPRFERFQSVTSCTIPRSISQSDSIGNYCCLTNSFLYPSLSIPVVSCSRGTINHIISIKSYEIESLLLLLPSVVLWCPLLCSACALCALCCELRAACSALSALLHYPTVLTLCSYCVHPYLVHFSRLQ